MKHCVNCKNFVCKPNMENFGLCRIAPDANVKWVDWLVTGAGEEPLAFQYATVSRQYGPCSFDGARFEPKEG